MKRSGWAAWAAATAATTGPTLSGALSISPRMSNPTSAECRSFETWSPLPGASGERTFRTSASRETRATTSFTAASKAGVPAVAVRLWTSTFSAAGRLNPSCRILSIRPDSPGPEVFGFGFFVPTAPPIPKATTTRASQPNVAVFQWLALQRPIRAARLRGRLVAVAVGRHLRSFQRRGGRGSRAAGHGISTSLTLVTVVRSATKNGSSASASCSVAASTVHQIACPPERQEASVRWWRSGLRGP